MLGKEEERTISLKLAKKISDDDDDDDFIQPINSLFKVYVKKVQSLRAEWGKHLL